MNIKIIGGIEAQVVIEDESGVIGCVPIWTPEEIQKVCGVGNFIGNFNEEDQKNPQENRDRSN